MSNKSPIEGVRVITEVRAVVPSHALHELIELGRYTGPDAPISCALCNASMHPSEALKGRLLIVQISKDRPFTRAICGKCCREHNKSHERLERVYSSRSKHLLMDGNPVSDSDTGGVDE